MATPLTDRNLALCSRCSDCITGKRCRIHTWPRPIIFKMAKPKHNSPEYWRGYYDANIEIRRQINKEWGAKNPEKLSASNELNRFISNGGLNRPNKCSICGIICFPQGHHPDYADKLAIIWVCNGCHKKIHNGSLIPNDNLIQRY